MRPNRFFLTILSVFLCSCTIGRNVESYDNTWDKLLDQSPSFSQYNPKGYPEENRKVYYHSTTYQHLDELGVINVLRQKRHIAVLSSFGENMALTKYSGKNINSIAEENSQAKNILGLVFSYIQEIDESGYLLYGLDYLWAPENTERDFKLMSGEGFPPFQQNYQIPKESLGKFQDAPFIESKFPAFIHNAPNGDYYPKSNRYVLFTTPIRSISSEYGDVVLSIIQDKERGVSLPDYCIEVHGDSCLSDPYNISYWEEGDKEEYVIPAYIPGRDVVSASIKYGYKKNMSPGREMRSYTRGDNGSIVIKDVCHTVIATMLLDFTNETQVKIIPESGFEKDFDVLYVSELLTRERPINPPLNYVDHPKLNEECLQ